MIYSLLGNSQHLDGGAMFGNVPRTLWSSWLPPDGSNRIKLACRCLLVQSNNKNILLETGIGAFFEPKLQERYGIVEKEHVLLSSLANISLSHEMIDYVILSHLHFDHAGGVLSTWQESAEPTLLFPNAIFFTSETAWERANHPHPRDKASFIPKLNQLLSESKRLITINSSTHPLLPEFNFHFSDGHTPGMMLTEIPTPKGPLIFGADLIPGMPWLHLPITMGYDRFPEMVIDEKRQLLQYLANNEGHLFFTHDKEIACVKIILDDLNRFQGVNAQKYIDRCI